MPKVVNKQSKWPIIGHSNIVSYLQNSLNNLKLAHAYLFVGPDHVGKTAVAGYFINSLVCQNLELEALAVPCHECQSCRQAVSGNHPDIYWLARELNEKTDKLKKNISIEQVRQLQNKLSLRSFLNSYKIAVVSEAQTLSLEAANSLLKVLEEPADRNILLLLATDVSSLPQTIVSRCRVIRFRPVADQEIFDYLISSSVERKKAKVLTALAFGRPGLALNYSANHDAYTDFQETVRHFVNLIDRDINSRFKMVGELLNNDIDLIKENLLIWSKALRDLLLIKSNLPNLVSNPVMISDLEKLAKNFRVMHIKAMISEISLAKKYLDSNVSPKLTLENLVLKF